MKLISACVIAVGLISAAHATDRFFPDLHEQSPSGRFQVDATSPDNKKKGHTPFQAQFTYKCVDTKTGNVIWTRKQAMGKPRRLSKDSDFELVLPQEPSPVAIYVSDNGSTAIHNAWDELIFVSRSGLDIGKVDLLDDALTDVEYKKYVHHTMAGPWWTGLSVWYYLNAPNGEFFVVRPWWGRRIFMDTHGAKLVQGDKSLIDAATETEERLVLEALSSAKVNRDYEMSKLDAAYLAGVLNLKRAVPLLKKAETSTYSGSCTFGGLSYGEEFNNEVDPHSYCTFSLRQVVQLSLRRLGEKPAPLPCHTFELKHGDKSTPFVPTPQEHPRHQNAQSLKVGMDAKQVLTLIGSPDFVGYDTWSYDMDAPEPFSITLTFDARRVTHIKRLEPLWKSGFSRDEALAY